MSDSETFLFYSMCNSSQFSSHEELEKSVKLSMALSRRRELNKTVEMDLGQSSGGDDIKLPKDAESSLSVSSATEKDGEESQPAQDSTHLH